MGECLTGAFNCGIRRTLFRKLRRDPSREVLRFFTHSTAFVKRVHFTKGYNLSFCNKIKGPFWNNFSSTMTLANNSVPTKSANDTRDYRVIFLNNGLKALLVSDLNSPGSDLDAPISQDALDQEFSGSESDEAMSDSDSQSEADPSDSTDSRKKTKGSIKLSAASLCVRSGSFSEPDNIPGFAHFLEHMVFMGSKKYPKETDFDAFIRKNGGGSNAFTDVENTVFFFDVHKKSFYEALDVFANFFVQPLLNKNSVDREVHAVDNEFDMSLTSDSSRKEQLIGSLASEGHPLTKFMWGNTETLKTTPEKNGLDIYAQLRGFCEEMYSAHYMTLAVQSKDTLDNLEVIVREIFSHIPNSQKPPRDFFELNKPFDNLNFHKLYKAVPIKNKHQLEVLWSLPSLLKEYKEKPLHYLGWLVGHEGKGSILSYLKKRYWATSINSGNVGSGFEHNSTQSVFSVCVTLTDEGMQHVEEVFTVIFSYIKMLQNAGPSERIFREIQTIEDNNFRWQEQSSPIDYVQTLSENMQYYPVEHYLTGDELLFEYDPALIKKCQDYLTPENALFFLYSKKYDNDQTCPLTEKWFNTKYGVEDVPLSWKEKWNKLDIGDDLHFPEPNEFIATNFDIQDPDTTSSELPVLVTDSDSSRLWYKKDNKFNVPKACIAFNLLTSHFQKSPKSAACIDLFLKLLHHNLNEAAYAADVAMLSYSIRCSDVGLVIKCSGFNHKLAKLFETIVDHIANFNCSKDLFDSTKEEILKVYYNEFIKPNKLTKELRLATLQEFYWTAVEKYSALKGVTLEHLLNFIKEFRKNVYVEGLVQGNLSLKESKSLEVYLLKQLDLHPAPQKPETKVYQLPKRETICHVKNLNPDDNNSMVTNYYQYGPCSVRENVLNQLVMMFMDVPVFDVLRTQEQLGYSVDCTNRCTYGILAFSITVAMQANKFSVEHVNERIENFLRDFSSSVIESMQDEEFRTVTNSLIQLKCCEDTHLGEEFDRNWAEITDRTYLFDRLTKEVAILKGVTKDELREWFHVISPSEDNVRKLSVQVEGVKSKPKRKQTQEKSCDKQDVQLNYQTTDSSKVNHITDTLSYKQNLTLFPESRVI